MKDSKKAKPISAERLLDTIAVNDRIMRVQRAVLTRNFADVSNADISFAVNAGWLPERFGSDPLGLGGAA